MDIFDKAYSWTDADEVRERGLYPWFLPLEDTEGTEVVVDGRKILMIGSNNYLGLTTDPRVRQAAIDAVKRYGTSCTGSRFLNGTLALHQEAEARLAAFVGMEAALVFSTGYQVNLGTISAMIGRGDVVVLDKDDHASIVDGALMALGDIRRFSHNDMDHLDRVLEKIDDDTGVLVVVDGVYSMGGDVAPLPDIIPIVKRHGARLMVDDAHSIGVMGGGRGTCAHFGVTEDVDLIMGTFSKSFASLGGFIAGEAKVMDYIQHHARSFVFSASMPASNVATVLAALDIMENEPEHVERLWEVTERMRSGLTEMGFRMGPSTTPIIPIIIGDREKTFLAWKGCFDAGLYTNAVIAPAVPPDMGLLRTSYMATHTDEQIDRALNILGEVGRELELIE
ncbi:MAG: pyridoxal phosphate-dependent aminotransferase family protein [Chloroflexi bacterium]|nr:pyridoxal phosphate-dependent aminotransferase family protein [Chloroflexota bacterium]MDK1044289.1 pyridoxal phosphate-dependent aminotransferase family protein [Anaerolineales bacterium]MCH8342132.1 pyridoxal phosphate-dependent aminotransferase family protein [Chloroflexota bacterium]MCH8875508.1 pyridoxal phosphate-dependent aminotransferase family protein [Chloroflexota bacterium]MCI0772651.1 pyridoxal phosphate-dependent aminotransferase family protein [Chloroflexota bacterium]